jgi:hypothetical protein
MRSRAGTAMESVRQHRAGAVLEELSPGNFSHRNAPPICLPTEVEG